MIKLDVTLTFPDGQSIFCGVIYTTDPDSRGRIEGAFQYTQDYLSHPRAFALDPEHLPLGPHEIPTDRPQGVHGVFEDALPDNWGRELLSKKSGLPRHEQTVPRLLAVMGSSGLGALSFSSDRILPLKDVSAGMHELNTIVEAAMRYDAGLPVEDDDLGVLFSCGSSPGGARPKALVKNKAGVQWIAKFPKLNDKYQVEALEAGTLRLALAAGLDVPEFTIQNAGERQVFLIRRFDVTGQGGRNHMISLQTLLGADGYYHLSYSDIFNVIRKYSTEPKLDTEKLYRQMVFNVAIGNTDDHLKNFCMIQDEFGFGLSPAYDLLPDINENREHRLSFPQGAGTLSPGRSILARIGSIYKVKDPEQVIDEVAEAVTDWRDVFWQCGASPDDLQRLDKSIARRLDRLLPESHQAPGMGPTCSGLI